MEENKNVSKKSWKRIFKKRWFFPALYLTVAALLLSGGVLWYQNVTNQVPDLAENMEDQLNGDLDKDQEDAESVMQQQEVLKMPVAEDLQTEIVTKFYDYGADAEEQEKALISHQNKYYQSDGIDISTEDNQAFDVMAALSGTVAEIKQDPLLGNVVKMEHKQGVTTYYASLGEVLVEEGTELKQGQTLGTAGQNSLGQDNGVHLHFEVRKDNEPVNPETYINQPINRIVAPESSDEDSDSAEGEEQEDKETTENSEPEGNESDDAEQGEEGSSEDSEQEDGESTDKTEEDESNSEEDSQNKSESSRSMGQA
ncbi:peptidoglycan DD-metalloendopeptidase family protein [Gracilibacillus sp. JCM 18860]|uniref:peptidoglycan DD-metalloendopeptidase family protein n=1 Tax=Gracilibacillus sp. JCM 18860 TaxID=1306159 RepID=UPI0006CF4762